MDKKLSFCKVYGNTGRNRVLDFLLENRELDFPISTIAIETELSRQRVYTILKSFKRSKLVKNSRTMSATNFYILNVEDSLVKILIDSFDRIITL